MPESIDNRNSLVDRSVYDQTLADLRSQHKLAFYLGKTNPYSGKLISTEDEAEAYLEMLAMSIMYQHSAASAIARADGAREGMMAAYKEKAAKLPAALKQIEQQKKDIAHLTNQVSVSISRIGDQETELQALKKEVARKNRQRNRARFLSAVLVVALIVGSNYVRQNYIEPADSSYSLGYKAGKIDGYAEGNSDGYISGYRTGISSGSNSSKSSSSSGSSSAAASFSSRINNSSSALQNGYKTSPYPGYSLDMTVYVSVSGGKIHTHSNCSGMKNYYTMTYGEACEHGYVHCSKCF